MKLSKLTLSYQKTIEDVWGELKWLFKQYWAVLLGKRPFTDHELIKLESGYLYIQNNEWFDNETPPCVNIVFVGDMLVVWRSGSDVYLRMIGQPNPRLFPCKSKWQAEYLKCKLEGWLIPAECLDQDYIINSIPSNLQLRTA